MTSSRSRRWLLTVAGVLALCLLAGAAWFATHRDLSDEERNDVREAAVRLLTEDAAVGRMPHDLGDRARAFEAGADERREQLASVWAPSALDEHVRDWEDAWKQVLRDKDYRAYDDNRFVVMEWREARKAGDDVEVVVRGHMEYRFAKTGQWVSAADGTEHLTLTRVGGEWRLHEERVEDYNPS